MTAHPSSQQAPHRKNARPTVAKRRLRRSRKRTTSSRLSQPPEGDPALTYWFGTFHRFHTDGATYVPHALRMVTLPASEHGGDLLPLAAGRYVVEVAEFQGAQGVRWMLIVWEIDVPGMRSCDCSSEDEAMALFAQPHAEAIPTRGVRVRPDYRPW